jgi:hypothetical protein
MLAEIDRLAAAFRDERAKLHDHRVRRLLEGIGFKVASDEARLTCTP